jgi:hypothetical protein
LEDLLALAFFFFVFFREAVFRVTMVRVYHQAPRRQPRALLPSPRFSNIYESARLQYA